MTWVISGMVISQGAALPADRRAAANALPVLWSDTMGSRMISKLFESGNTGAPSPDLDESVSGRASAAGPLATPVEDAENGAEEPAGLVSGSLR